MSNNVYLGQNLKGYRLSAQLASSDSGQVYLAQTSTLPQKTVVAKIVHRKLTTLQERQQFLREAGIVKDLQHAHLLPLFDAGIDQDAPYLVMEYASHGSLRSHLLRTGEQMLSLSEAIKLLVPMGQALAYLHKQGLVHGNLKPENVLFSAKECILLADMHIVTVNPARKVSPQSDLYALSCIAYELLTGHAPVSGEISEQTLLAPFYYNSSLPSYVDEVILKALSPQEESRYVDVESFLRALQGEQQDEPFILAEPLPEDTHEEVAGAPFMEAPVAPGPFWRSPKKSTLGLALAIIMAFLVIGASLIIPLLSKQAQNTQIPQQRVQTAISSPGVIPRGSARAVVSPTAGATPSSTAGATPIVIPKTNPTILPASTTPIAAQPSTPAQTSLVNGSFETPNLNGGYQYGVSGAGWYFGGLINNGSGITGNNNALTAGAGSAPDGVQAAFLQGTGFFNQGVNFNSGTYRVTFQAEQRAGNSQNFAVLIDGQTIGTYTPKRNSYQTFSTSSFTLAAGAHILQFQGLDWNGASDTAFIDIVTIIPV